MDFYLYLAKANDPCADAICKNNGQCKVSDDASLAAHKNIECKCKDGYFGLDCSQKYSCGNCAFEKCENNGRCKECLQGWKGPNCVERNFDNKNICGANGI